MMERAAGSLRSSQNGPKNRCLFYLFIFFCALHWEDTFRFTAKTFFFVFVVLFLSSLVMVTLCLSKERATEGRAQMRS